MQTIINRNELFYSGKNATARVKDLTILAGEGTDLKAGTVFVPNAANKMILPDNYDTIRGWSVLLEDADATADIVAKFGIVGEIDAADLILAGTVAAYDDIVRQSLQLNGIFVNNSTDAIQPVNPTV